MTLIETFLLVLTIEFLALNLIVGGWFLYKYRYYQHQNQWKRDIEQWARDVEYPNLDGVFNGDPTDPEQYRISTTDEAAFSNPDNTFIYAGWDAPDEVIAPWTCTNSPVNPLVVLNPDASDYNPRSVSNYQSFSIPSSD